MADFECIVNKYNFEQENEFKIEGDPKSGGASNFARFGVALTGDNCHIISNAVERGSKEILLTVYDTQ